MKAPNGARVGLLVVAALCAAAGSGRAQSGEARGVNPADNISKMELLPKVSIVDDEVGISAPCRSRQFRSRSHYPRRFNSAAMAGCRAPRRT